MNPSEDEMKAMRQQFAAQQLEGHGRGLALGRGGLAQLQIALVDPDRVQHAARIEGEVRDVVSNWRSFAKKVVTANPAWGAVLVDFIVGVFQPLIPAIAGAGVLKSLLLLVSSLGWTSTKSDTYVVLSSIADATFFFLPLMVAGTTATKLGVNRLVAIAACAPLVLPSLTALIKEPGLSVFGIPITNVPYNSQVFPSLLIVLFLAVMERFWTRVSPKPIRIFFVPMMSLLITVPVGLVALGPLGYNLGLVFTGAILWVFSTFGWVATMLLAMALPFLVSLGMHKPFLPYAINQYSTTGAEPLYLPASLAHNIAESGTMFGVAVRTKNGDVRSTAVSAGISALFGITEPALYGVTMRSDGVSAVISQRLRD